MSADTVIPPWEVSEAVATPDDVFDEMTRSAVRFVVDQIQWFMDHPVLIYVIGCLLFWWMLDGFPKVTAPQKPVAKRKAEPTPTPVPTGVNAPTLDYFKQGGGMRDRMIHAAMKKLHPLVDAQSQRELDILFTGHLEPAYTTHVQATEAGVKNFGSYMRILDKIEAEVDRHHANYKAGILRQQAINTAALEDTINSFNPPPGELDLTKKAK